MTREDSAEEYDLPELHPSAAKENEAKEKLELLVGQVLGSALDEIDRVIAELENVRNKLRNEGQHVERLILNHINLNNATMDGMKIISDSLKAWQLPKAND